MKKIFAGILVLAFCCVGLCGCGSEGNYEDLIKEYFEKEYSDADGYSYDITNEIDIDDTHKEYDDIIEYATDKYDCSESDIEDIKELEVDVIIDKGYEEEYQANFMVGIVDGEWKLIDKVDGTADMGRYEYGGIRGGTHTVHFGS